MNTETTTATTERNTGTALPESREDEQRRRYTAMLWRKAEELASFCLKEGAKAFIGWEPKLVFTYCFHHLASKTVFVEHANGKIVAVLFAWGINAADVLARNERDEPIFQFGISKDGADSLFCAEVIGSRRRLRKVIRMATARWPDWQSRCLFTYRIDGRGVRRLEQIRPAVVKRLIYGFQPAGRRN